MSRQTELTKDEVYLGAFTGIRRRIESMFANREDKHGYDGTDKWDLDIESAIGEVAAAKATDKFWSGSVNTFKGPDIGKKVQVRTTDLPQGSLIIRAKDDPAHFFVLVTGRAPIYQVVGWIRGLEGRQDKFLRNPNGREPAWFIPQNAIVPFV